MLLFLLLAYLLAQLAIVAIVSRSISTEHDYYLSNSGLSTGFATLSIFATWFGVESCIGSSSTTYAGGLFSTRAEPFGYTLCLCLMGALLAPKLWARKKATLADLFCDHYKSITTEKLAALTLLPAMAVWAGAQIRAFGHILSNLAPIDPTVAMGIAVIIVIAYGCLGGLIGDVITDVVQGTVLIIGLTLLFFFTLNHFHASGFTFTDIAPERLSLIPKGESLLQRMDVWLIPIIGSLTTQEILFRIVGSRSAKVAKNSCYLAAGLYLLVGLLPVGIGLMGPHLLPDIPHPDGFLNLAALTFLPTGLAVIFTGALVSAILSTVDSTLLAISALTTHNIAGRYYYKLGEKRRLAAAKLATAAAGIAAYFIAYYGGDVYQLVVFASSLGTAGLFIVTVMCLYAPNFGGSIAACMALITGLIATPLLEMLPAITAPFLTAILLSLSAYCFGAQIDKRLKTSKN